jgi:hypothetical protein
MLMVNERFLSIFYNNTASQEKPLDVLKRVYAAWAGLYHAGYHISRHQCSNKKTPYKDCFNSALLTGKQKQNWYYFYSLFNLIVPEV